MTGVAHAVMVSGTKAFFVVTIGTTGGNTYGYNDGVDIPGPGAFGGISPSTYRGATVSSAYSVTSGSTVDFAVSINGTRAQSFFRRIICQRTDGSLAIYDSAVDVIYSQNASYAQWTWIGSANPVWSNTTPGSRIVTIEL